MGFNSGFKGLKSSVPLHHSDKVLLNCYSLMEISTAQTPRYSALLPSQWRRHRGTVPSCHPSGADTAVQCPPAIPVQCGAKYATCSQGSSASLQKLLSIYGLFLQSSQEKSAAACSATQQVNSSCNPFALHLESA